MFRFVYQILRKLLTALLRADENNCENHLLSHNADTILFTAPKVKPARPTLLNGLYFLADPNHVYVLKHCGRGYRELRANT